MPVAVRYARPLALLVGVVTLGGCGSTADVQVVEGRVTVGDQTPDSGEIRFVPIDGTPGSVAAASIVDGQYRIAGRGGLVVGTYRVEIVAKKKTGRQTEQDNGFEVAMVDEQVQISATQYGGADSPLTHQVSSDRDGSVDFKLTGI